MLACNVHTKRAIRNTAAMHHYEVNWTLTARLLFILSIFQIRAMAQNQQSSNAKDLIKQSRTQNQFRRSIAVSTTPVTIRACIQCVGLLYHVAEVYNIQSI